MESQCRSLQVAHPTAFHSKSNGLSLVSSRGDSLLHLPDLRETSWLVFLAETDLLLPSKTAGVSKLLLQ